VKVRRVQFRSEPRGIVEFKKVCYMCIVFKTPIRLPQILLPLILATLLVATSASSQIPADKILAKPDLAPPLIAFSIEKEIWVTNLKKEGFFKVRQGEQYSSPIAYGHDGKSILIQTWRAHEIEGGYINLDIVNLDGTGFRSLTAPEYLFLNWYAAALAPDTSKLAIIFTDFARNDKVQIVNIATGKALTLSPSTPGLRYLGAGGFGGGIAWSPDSKHLIYFADPQPTDTFSAEFDAQKPRASIPAQLVQVAMDGSVVILGETNRDYYRPLLGHSKRGMIAYITKSPMGSLEAMIAANSTSGFHKVPLALAPDKNDSVRMSELIVDSRNRVLYAQDPSGKAIYSISIPTGKITVLIEYSDKGRIVRCSATALKAQVSLFYGLRFPDESSKEIVQHEDGTSEYYKRAIDQIIQLDPDTSTVSIFLENASFGAVWPAL